MSAVSGRRPALGGATAAAAMLLPLLLLLTVLDSARAEGGETLQVVPLRKVAKNSRLKSLAGQGAGDTLHYSFNVGRKTVELNLVQTDLTLPSLPVYSDIGGQMARINLRSDDTDMRTKFYHDVNAGAAIAATEATISADGIVGHRLEGTLSIDGVPYSLRPLNASKSGSCGRRVTRLVKAETARHELKPLQVPATTGDLEDGAYASLEGGIGGETARPSARPRGGAAGSTRRTKRSGAASYVVNMCYVIDCSLFNRFLQFESATDPNRVENAMRQARYYFAQVSNAVNSRYRGIDSMPWQMGTKLTGLYIYTNASQCYWTEPFKQTVAERSRPVVNASQVIDTFDEWILATDVNSSYDHCVLFTGYDIYKAINGTANYDVVGLAYVGGACTSQRAAVVEASGALNEGETHAHELGHNLAAQHDGAGNNCSSADHFIMATTAEATTNTTHQNFFRFSPCTLSSFDNFIGFLNADSQNCLLDDQPYFNQTEFLAYSLIPPGQRYNATVQCQQALGLNWVACGGSTYGSEICTSLWCHNDDFSTEGCQSAIGGARGAEGTTCGNKKWCQMGVCVSNASAPAASDTCPQGESKARVFNNYNYTCSSMPAWLCYQSYVRDKCCESCPKLYNASSVGCEYGDKLDSCSTISLSDCYDASVRNSCCSFCQRPKTNVTGCEWGDLYSNCASLTGEGFCYSNDSASCCQSCARRYDARSPSCPYGDRSDSQCANMTAYECDNGAASDCCGTCARVAATTTTIATTTTTSTTTAAPTTTRTSAAATTRTTALSSAAGGTTTAAARTSAAGSSSAGAATASTLSTTRSAVSWRTPTLFVKITYPPRVRTTAADSAAVRLAPAPLPLLLMLTAAVSLANVGIALSLSSARREER